MAGPRIFEDISARLSELAASGPAKDIEKNVKALMGSAFEKLDLVTREEFDLQSEMLAHSRHKLMELEARVAVLEQALADQRSAGQAPTQSDAAV